MLLCPGSRALKSKIIAFLASMCNRNFPVFVSGCLPYNRSAMKTLLKKLIQAESTASKGESAVADVLCAALRQGHVECRVDRWDQNRASVIARVRSAGPRGTGHRPGLLFGCHLDVVGPGEAAWTHPPFEAAEADGKIYGRGAVDMKGGTAAAAAAILRVVSSGRQLQGDIILAALAGEETDSSGAERFVAQRDELPELAGVIVPEPTGLKVVTAHRGLLWLEATTTGKAAHSSAPHLGVNAIGSMRLILNELENYSVSDETHELLGRCTMSINTISGGKTLNVVPDKCTLGIDIRTLPGQDHRRILGDLQAILARLKAGNSNFDADVSVLRWLESLETDSDCDFVRNLCTSVGAKRTEPIGYTTDGPYFASLGAPVVIFGPGKPELCHKPDEYIEIDELQRAAEQYEQVILKFLS